MDGGDLRFGRTEEVGGKPASDISDMDVFAALFADAHGRSVTAADRYIGERMRAKAAAWGFKLVREERRDANSA